MITIRLLVCFAILGSLALSCLVCPSLVLFGLVTLVFVLSLLASFRLVAIPDPAYNFVNLHGTNQAGTLEERPDYNTLFQDVAVRGRLNISQQVA